MGVGRGRRRPADPPRSRATRLRSPGHRSSRRCPVRWGAQRASARSRPRRSRWATGCHQSWPAASSRGRAPGSTPDVFGVPESPARGGDDRVLGSARGARGGPRERRRANRTIWYDMGPLEPVRLARSILVRIGMRKNRAPQINPLGNSATALLSKFPQTQKNLHRNFVRPLNEIFDFVFGAFVVGLDQELHQSPRRD